MPLIVKHYTSHWFLLLRQSVRAVAYMTMMVLLLSILETMAMYLSRSYPVPMCLEPLRRSYCVDGAAACATHGDAPIHRLKPGGQIVTATLLLGSTLFSFGALSFLPLAEVKAISFVSPLLVTIFCGLVACRSG